MSNDELDRLIEMINTDPRTAIDKLIAEGEPALCRLLDAMRWHRVDTARQVGYRCGRESRDGAGRLAAIWPDKVKSMVQNGELKMSLSIILGLGQSGNARLKEIAKKALKAGDF